MAKYKKKNVYTKKKVDTPTEDIQVKQTKTAKRKSLKSTVKPCQAAGPFGSLVSGKLILIPVSSGQRAGIFSITGDEPNT